MASKYKEPELLSVILDELTRSVGINAYGSDTLINSERETALDYYKGVMDDMRTPRGRSSAKSSDVADAVETALPDLIEIFTGSDDVAVFAPVGPEDEEAAQQETDYINHVFFDENNGYEILYSAIKDALQAKTGIFKWYGVTEKGEDEIFKGKTMDEFLVALMQHQDRIELKTEIEYDEMGQPVTESVDYIIKGEERFCAKVCSVPPEDFAVSRDTVDLKEAPYVAHRIRIRAYELIKRGIKKSIVDMLPAYGMYDVGVKEARDIGFTIQDTTGGLGDHRLVEIVEHYLDGEDGRIRITTDGACAIVVEKAQPCPRVPFSAITPFPVAHQFYGQSLADKLLEIQRIKTTLLRLMLDSGFFAMNQRMYVNMKKANQWTFADLMRNEPNVPIRGDGPASETIQPVPSAGLNFDVMGAMEYVSVMAEGRTGIVRNAQGLNPDTLHETASGAAALATSAMKRLRLMARNMAQGIGDMFVGLHDLLRENATGSSVARLRNQWVEIDPTAWGVRNDMTIEVGVGASNKEMQAALLTRGLEFMQGVIQMQGGVQGPFVREENVYAFGKRFLEKGLEFKSADPFWSDPNAEDAPPPPEPAPDPEMLKMQAEQQMQAQRLEFDKEKAAVDLEMAREKAAAELELEQMKAQAKLESERENAALKMQFEREKAEQEMQLARDKANFEAELAMQKAQSEAEIAFMQMESAERTAMSKNRPGGDLDK